MRPYWHCVILLGVVVIDMNLSKLLKQRRDLLKVEFHSEQFGLIEADLYDELYFSQGEVFDHMQCQAGMIAWWSAIYRSHEAYLDKLEVDYQVWFSLHYEIEFERLWERLGKTKSRIPSISSVENAVKLKHKRRYKDWQDKIRTVRHEVAELKDIVRWYEEKGMMLIQLAKVSIAELGFTDFRAKKQEEEVNKLRRSMK